MVSDIEDALYTLKSALDHLFGDCEIVITKGKPVLRTPVGPPIATGRLEVAAYLERAVGDFWRD